MSVVATALSFDFLFLCAPVSFLPDLLLPVRAFLTEASSSSPVARCVDSSQYPSPTPARPFVLSQSLPLC